MGRHYLPHALRGGMGVKRFYYGKKPSLKVKTWQGRRDLNEMFSFGCQYIRMKNRPIEFLITDLIALRCVEE